MKMAGLVSIRHGHFLSVSLALLLQAFDEEFRDMTVEERFCDYKCSSSVSLNFDKP